MCELKNVKNIISSEPENESTDQKRNAIEMIPEANRRIYALVSPDKLTYHKSDSLFKVIIYHAYLKKREKFQK